MRGLEAGADDYLAQTLLTVPNWPPRVAGLIASRRRLKARLEHAGSSGDVSESPSEWGAIHDPAQRRARRSPVRPPVFHSVTGLICSTWIAARCSAGSKAKPGSHRKNTCSKKRLQAAARLLTDRAGNVAEVADAVGFVSVSHFSRRFQRTFLTSRRRPMHGAVVPESPHSFSAFLPRLPSTRLQPTVRSLQL